jgi:hypothetical protein
MAVPPSVCAYLVSCCSTWYVNACVRCRFRLSQTTASLAASCQSRPIAIQAQRTPTPLRHRPFCRIWLFRFAPRPSYTGRGHGLSFQLAHWSGWARPVPIGFAQRGRAVPTPTISSVCSRADYSSNKRTRECSSANAAIIAADAGSVLDRPSTRPPAPAIRSSFWTPGPP